MSVYATILSIQHPEEMDAKLAEVGIGSYHGSALDHERRLGSPRPYRGSHILPAENDERRGQVEVGAIPLHVRQGREGIPEEERDMETMLPYLRLTASPRTLPDFEQETVVLDREQVTELRDALSRWLREATAEG